MERCELCKFRVCTNMEKGRLVNDNVKGKTDLSKIKMVEKKIEECETREVLEWSELARRKS